MTSHPEGRPPIRAVDRESTAPVGPAPTIRVNGEPAEMTRGACRLDDFVDVDIIPTAPVRRKRGRR